MKAQALQDNDNHVQWKLTLKVIERVLKMWNIQLLFIVCYSWWEPILEICNENALTSNMDSKTNRLLQVQLQREKIWDVSVLVRKFADGILLLLCKYRVCCSRVAISVRKWSQYREIPSQLIYKKIQLSGRTYLMTNIYVFFLVWWSY